MSNAHLKQEIKRLRQENEHLKSKVSALKAKLRDLNQLGEASNEKENQYLTSLPSHIQKNVSIKKYSSTAEKVHLFASLFKGRQDVYAERFIHSQTGKPSYAPKKLPYWEKTDGKEYAALTTQVYEEHLRGNKIIGVFPITSEDESSFLAIDFDGKEWKKDIIAIREVCDTLSIPISVERSRSGDGAHAWFFFTEKIKASIVRKLGTEIVKMAMSLRHELTFDSFDRLFPNQDFVPKGGFGNLIALPLQKKAREKFNSVFVNHDFIPYEDQWAYLSSIEKISGETVGHLIQELKEQNGSEKGQSKKQEKLHLSQTDFPEKVNMVLSNMIFIEKKGLSSKAISELKWMASFHNPEFYQLQSMRRSTYRVQRVISCFEENQDYIGLPRGLHDKIFDLFIKYNVELEVDDLRENGNGIDVHFNGVLRPQQSDAVAELLKRENGVLCGSTAFGKTIAALHIIAERKVNTLILVNKVSLAEQWQKRIDEFLIFNNSEKMVGQLGGGKKTITNNIDVALMQSLYRKNVVNDCVKNYGMVIIDECHHISAFSFEKIMNQTTAKYVYGLTATPKRKDGHDPIIHMQCGPVRYQDNIKDQTLNRPFDHTMLTRFTPLNPNLSKNMTLAELYQGLLKDTHRNEMMIEDIIDNHRQKRCSIVLTERIDHIKLLHHELSKMIGNVFELSGKRTKKQNKETLEKISIIPADEPFTIISTGKYIGEGYDEPRLDTLFLVMPISWKGRLQQYAGRLHRLHEGKNEVRIYDYADIHIPVLDNMYQKRLKGYKSMGYLIKIVGDSETQSVFDLDNYAEKLQQDLIQANEKIIISSPSLTQKGKELAMKMLKEASVEIELYTKNPHEINNKNYRASRCTLMKELSNQKVKVNIDHDVSQCCILIDGSTIWYGSIHLFGYNSKDSSFIRLESPVIMKEFKNMMDIK